jgi:DNA polymerase-1
VTGVLDHVQVHLVESIDDAAELKRWMSERRPYVAVDTETEGLRWWEHRPRLLQVGDRDEAWVLPWDLWGGAILEVLRDFDGDLVMHNATFDVHMFEHWSGVTLPRARIQDTRPLAHILDPNRSTALKPLAAELVDRKAVYSERILREAMDANGWTWATVPLDFQPYWLYAGLDTVLTSRVYDQLRPLVDAEAPAAYELEMAACWTFMAMERKGMEVDREFTRDRLGRMRDFVDRTGAWVREHFGVKAGSNSEVVRVLHEATGYEFTERTPKGKARLDREVLADVVARTGHPLAQAVFDRRRIQRLCTTYLDKFLEYSEYDGRVHCSYNALKLDTADGEWVAQGYGARTGRVSISNPPLQQLPKRDSNHPAAHAVRQCLTATGGGETHKLVLSDFDQVEARLFGSFSRDPGLRAAFESGDFFTNLARPIYHDDGIDKSDPRRFRTKTATYARLYGAQEDTIAQAAGVSTGEALAFMRRFDELFPRTVEFTAEVERRARQRLADEGQAYVRSPLTNRRLPCKGDRVYALLNYLIQGTASELLKQKVVEMHKAGLGDMVTLTVHDEVILDVPNDRVEDVSATVAGVMNDATMFEIPITAETEVAPRWGNKA